MTDFVLDNSVTMRWCFDAGSHDYADTILRLLETRQATAWVPVLWRYDVSAVLARAETKGLLTGHASAEFLEDLAALDVRIDPDGAALVLNAVHQPAISYRLTTYDAAYLELAIRR